MDLDQLQFLSLVSKVTTGKSPEESLLIQSLSGLKLPVPVASQTQGSA